MDPMSKFACPLILKSYPNYPLTTFHIPQSAIPAPAKCSTALQRYYIILLQRNLLVWHWFHSRLIQTASRRLRAVSRRLLVGPHEFKNEERWTERVRVFCGMQNAESCQGVICEKSSAERCANYQLSLFCIPQPKKFCISADHKTTVRSRCTTDVQPMHSSVRRPGVLSFRILCCLFAKEQGSCFTISTNFKLTWS